LSRYRNILITGAGGFVGGRLTRRLLATPALASSRFIFADRSLTAIEDDRVTLIEGDISDASVRRAMTEGGVDLVFHLAGVLGGAAEADPALARRINLDASMSLLEELRSSGARPRIVYASSIAVFGPPLPALIDDDTPAQPLMIYGAQKLMMEIALAQFSARGWLDGVSLRLPGIVPRPGADARLRSSFLSQLFEGVKAGRPVTLPVSPDGTTWLLSLQVCVDALVHAALAPDRAFESARTITLPAQNVRIGDLVGALQAACPSLHAFVSYAPDVETEAQFARQPPLRTPKAERLGFRHDGDLASLVQNALATLDTSGPAGD